MIAKVCFLVATLALFTCATSALGEDYSSGRVDCSKLFTPSSILKTGIICDGQQVVISGVLRDGSEMHGLWDSAEAIDFSNYGKKCITTYNPKGLDIAGPVRKVNIHGTFRAKRPEGIVILGSCGDAVIEIDQVRDLE